jgi:hypothetical protein
MPRNDQITRQWHLLRQLDGSSGRSLQELVDNVPEDYPKNARTVRRYNKLSVHFAPFPPPYDRLAERRGFHSLLSLPEMGIPWTQNGEWVQKSYLASNRATVLRLLRVVSDSMKVFFEEKEKTLGYLSEFLGTNREDTEYAYQLYLKWAERNPRPKIDSVRSLLESIKKTTPKAATADPASFIDVSLVNELMQAGYFK